MHKALTLSVIILAYNEEDQLPACLDAIAAQTVRPTEVIVVDNNSTDNTAAIARSYPFVRLIHESEQGMIPARNRGLNEATGEILARIDADSRVAPDWAERLYRDFAQPGVMAVAGVSRSLLLPNAELYSSLWSRGYLFWMRMLFNIPIVWGSNMALRRSAWHVIRDDLTPDGNIVHEDQDIAVILAKHQQHVITDTRCMVTTECQDKVEWPKYSEYMKRTFRTRQLHRDMGSFETAKSLYSPIQRVGFLMGFIPVKIVFLIFAVGVATMTMHMRQLQAYIDAYLDIEKS